MIAQYAGTCKVCGNGIEPGASIIYSKAQGSRHTGCEADSKAPAPAARSNGNDNGAGKPTRLSLAKDRPATIALKYPGGKRVSSKWGADEMFYTLVDGRVAYFPLAVAEEIKALEIQAGEEFVICHHGGADWEIVCQEHGNPSAAGTNGQQAPAAPLAAKPQPSSSASQSMPARETMREALIREFERPPARYEKTPAPAGKVNGQGEDLGAIQRRCYDVAIANALYAVEQARAQGLMISPTFGDIRAMATSLLINATGGRG